MTPAPGARLVRRALEAAVLLVLACSVPASAQELHGLLGSSYSATTTKSSQGTSADFENLRETLDVNWNKRVSPTLGYRLFLRSERVDSTSTLRSQDTETRTETSTLLLQPALDATLTAEPYSLNAGIRLRELFTEQEQQSDFNQSERNVFLRFFYRQELLPSVGLLFEKTTATDNVTPAPRDEETTRYQLLTQYALAGLNLGYTFGRRVQEDHRLQRTETQDSHVGTAGYAGKFFEDTLAVQTDLSVNYTTTLEEFLVAGTAEFTRSLDRGLRADPDATPLDSSDVPLVNEPALVNGTANIPLTLQSAVGFGLAAPEEVAEIRITLAPEPPFTLPANLASFVTFRVFFTNDTTLTAWTEVAGVSGSFDQVQSRFTLTFPATTARFFKAWVSRNDFGALVKATGIAAPTTEAVTAGSERSRSTQTNAVSGVLTYTPVKWLTAAYNGNLSTTSQEPESIETTSGTHAFSLTLRPHEKVTTTGSFNYSYSESNQEGALDSSLTSYGLTVGWVPLTTLSTTLALTRSEDSLGGEPQSRSDRAGVSAAAKVFPGLNLDSSYGVSQTESFTINQSVFGQDLAFRVAAQLTPWASMIGNYGLQVRETTPAPEGADARTVTNTVGGGTVYTLSRLVNFTTRFDFVSTAAGNSFTQQYKADWVPTSKTSLFVSYFTTHGDFGETTSTSDTIRLNGRWSLSRALDLSADYSFSRTQTGDIVQDIQSFSMTASLRF